MCRNVGGWVVWWLAGGCDDGAGVGTWRGLRGWGVGRVVVVGQTSSFLAGTCWQARHLAQHVLGTQSTITVRVIIGIYSPSGVFCPLARQP